LPVNQQRLPIAKVGSKVETEVVLQKLGVNYKDNAPQSEYVVSNGASGIMGLSQRVVNRDKVPNVIGMPLNDAVYLLENHELFVRVKGSGKVISQSISPGTPLQKGETINLVLG
jgi:cell division protein FtsI (penicillin-binding protein 3)